MSEIKQEIVIDSQQEGKRLDIFLSSVLNQVRAQIKNNIKQGNVLVNNKVVKAGLKLKQGDRIGLKSFKIVSPKLVAQDIKLDIVYQNQDFAVINKPQGMVVHPAAGNFDGTLVNALLYHFDSLSTSEDLRPGIVHRLDKNTSGLILVAKNNKAFNYFGRLLKQHEIKKKYIALCSGYFSQKQGQIVTGIGRDEKNRKKMAIYPQGQKKLAITNYKVLEEFNGFCLVEFDLVTGRTHQIRVHASHLKHPIVGDDVYGGNTKLHAGGQLLHAYSLEFISPTDNKLLKITQGLPDYFLKIIEKLKKN